MSTPPTSRSDQGPGSPREDQRLAALRALQVLDTPREAAFDDITALVADICQTPIALITLIDESRQWFKSAVGLTVGQTPREIAFCTHALDHPDLLLVPDATQDPRFAANPLVTGEPRIRFYAGAPLVTPEGHTLGTLCVIDRVPRQLTERQLTALRVLGRQVMTELQLRHRLREQAKAEEALRQSEREQRALVQNLETERARLVEAQAVAKVGSWETDLATMAVIWSEETHRIFETDAVNFVPTHARFLERVHPDDRAAVDQTFQQSLGSREIQALEHRVLLPGGRIKFIMERWQVYGNESGRPVRAIGTCRDITERKMAEEERNRLFNLSLDLLCVAGFDGRLQQVNPAWTDCLGWSAEELTSRPMLDFVHPDDHAATLQSRAQIHGGTPSRGFENRYRRKDGGYRWLSWSVHPLTQLRQVFGVARDVTAVREAQAALQASEEQYRLLFASNPHPMWVFDLETLRILAANKAAVSHYGYSEAEFLAMRVIDLRAPEDAVTFADAIAWLPPPGKATALRRHRRKDGTIIEVEATSDSVVLAGRPARLVLAHDVTERRKTAEALGRNESLLRMATQVSRLGAWQVEVPTMALTWSDELRAIHETPPGFTPTVEDGLNAYAPEFQERIRQVFGACVERGVPFDEELQIITATGKRVWVRALGEAVRDEAGKIVRVQGAFQDISDRKNAELAQQQLTQRLATTLENITDGFFTLDRDWRFTYVNAEAERMILRQRTDLLGTSVWDAFPGTVGRTFEREYRRAVAENVAVSFEDYYPQLDKWFEVRAYPSEAGLAVYFRDVTATRQAAQVLRVSEERFRLLAKATNDAIWDWDLTTQALWWNEGFETLFGFSRPEVESTIDSWLNRLHPDDKAAVVADVHRAIDGGAESWQGEYRFRRKDGGYAFVLDRGHIIRERDGKAVRMIGGMTDLTELKQADEKLREQAALLDNAHDAIMVRDATHHITYWNKAAERLYGWTAAEARGRRLDELLRIDALQFAQAQRATDVAGGWNGEIQKTAKSGAVLTVEGSWTLLRDDQGVPRSILTIDTDITERKKLEQQFLRAQRMESIGTLAGGIAHDLNNLLAPITMGVDLLKLFEPNPRSLPVIENIERSARRGADLVKQVLSFARGVEGARVMLQVRHILKEVESIAVNTFPKNINVETVVPQDLWPVLADPTQLNQVVLNLCVNARDAMPDGGRLDVTAANVVIDAQYAVMNRGVAAGRYVVIQVTDTGTGMPKEIIDRIFEPFFTTKELGKGTGLGLSTVLGIVRSHGGFVNVYSEIGRGSTFKVYLPAHEAGDGPAAEGSAGALLPRGNGELILVVDDEPSILDITKQTLLAFGYRVLTAEDGAQAISLYALQRDEVALVITDMMMPVMDGTTLILALQRINPRIRVIAASGLKGNSDVARAASAGVKQFLPKPYSADTLLQLISQVLQEGNSRPPL